MLVENEQKKLLSALRQYALASEVLLSALNYELGDADDTQTADHFTFREFQLFAAATEKTVLALTELAKRDRILPTDALAGDEAAIARLNESLLDQYLYGTALASQAVTIGQDDPATAADERELYFLNNGGYEIINNLGRIMQQSESIRAGLNPFGYDDAFVPLKAFSELLELTCGGTSSCGSGGLLATATNAGDVTPNSTATALDVSANDSDGNDDLLTITSVGRPANGTATTDGSMVNYTPNAGIEGTDRFIYTVSDGKLFSVATAVVNVAPSGSTNSAPLAANDTASTAADTAITLDVLDNDIDGDGDTLAITEVSTPASGTATIASGKITYTPMSGFSGVDSFTYTISDGKGGTSSGTVTVNVASESTGSAPVANDDGFIVAPDSQNISLTVLVNDITLAFPKTLAGRKDNGI